MSAPPAWLADPTGRHQMRYWDGQQWTDYVSDAGAQSTDPVGSPGTAAAAAKPSWMDKVTSAANQAVDATSAAVDSAADSLSSKPSQAPVAAQPAASAAPPPPQPRRSLLQLQLRPLLIPATSLPTSSRSWPRCVIRGTDGRRVRRPESKIARQLGHLGTAVSGTAVITSIGLSLDTVLIDRSRR